METVLNCLIRWKSTSTQLCTDINIGDSVVYSFPSRNITGTVDRELTPFNSYKILDYYDDGSRGVRILINNGKSEQYYNWKLFGTISTV